MGHAEHDVGIRHYTPEGFETSELLEAVSAVTYDISMVRRPFAERQSVGAVADLSAHRAERRRFEQGAM
jgi:hypothetical protein